MKNNPTAGILLLILGAAIFAFSDYFVSLLSKAGAAGNPNDIGPPIDTKPSSAGAPGEPGWNNPSNPPGTSNASYPGAFVGEKGAVKAT